jgi:predicted transcriptional regulator
MPFHLYKQADEQYTKTKQQQKLNTLIQQLKDDKFQYQEQNPKPLD